MFNLLNFANKYTHKQWLKTKVQKKNTVKVLAPSSTVIHIIFTNTASQSKHWWPSATLSRSAIPQPACLECCT